MSSEKPASVRADFSVFRHLSIFLRDSFCIIRNSFCRCYLRSRSLIFDLLNELLLLFLFFLLNLLFGNFSAQIVIMAEIGCFERLEFFALSVWLFE